MARFNFNSLTLRQQRMFVRCCLNFHSMGDYHAVWDTLGKLKWTQDEFHEFLGRLDIEKILLRGLKSQ